MFHFQTLDVYRCAVAFLPIGYALAKLGDGEMASQLRRTALSINVNIAELESAAILDAMQVVGIADPRIGDGHALLVRVVSMLTKMIG